MRCLRKNLSVIGTVFEALIYQLDEIIMQFDKGISALTSEALVQAGQIPRQRDDGPLTLMSLYDTLQRDIFKPIALAHEILANGVIDFLVAEDDQHQKLQLVDDMLESVDQKDKSVILLDKVKPADRVTFMLNSMFLALRNN